MSARSATQTAIATAIVLSLCSALALAQDEGADPDRPPNFILIFVDNLGYGDVGCFGSPKHQTPYLDRMAAEGMKLTHCYATAGVCTPSRASLMTGCYPRRIGLDFPAPDGAVLRPMSPNGLHPDEITIAEILKTKGYATTIIGKWHLGDQPVFLPTRQGFDSFLGIPYSDNAHKRSNRPHWPELPLMQDEKVIEQPVDRDYLTKRYTERAIEFMTEKRDQPFFIYLPHAMPGSTTTPYSSPAFKGKSENGDWGDSVEELDWSTGEIIAALKRLDLDDNTLMIWMSDNGAPKRKPLQGINLPMGGWGYTTREGGQRVPCIARWPGKIPAGKECAEVAVTFDFLPTFAKLAGADVPTDRVIDGRDIWPLLAGEKNAKSPHEAFYYYYLDQLQCVRSGEWKLRLPLKKKFGNLSRNRPTPDTLALFNVADDPLESKNLAAEHADIVARLTDYAERAREDLGDWDRPGKNNRPIGKISGKPKPQMMSQ